MAAASTLAVLRASDPANVGSLTRMARAALELVTPFLRRGAVVVCDNTESLRAEYADYFAFIASAANRPSTMTLPFHGGLEMTVFP